MLDWTAYVRECLRLRGFRPEREAEIVEEVARQMEDAYSEALRLGANDLQASEIAKRRRSGSSIVLVAGWGWQRMAPAFWPKPPALLSAGRASTPSSISGGRPALGKDMLYSVVAPISLPAFTHTYRQTNIYQSAPAGYPARVRRVRAASGRCFQNTLLSRCTFH